MSGNVASGAGNVLGTLWNIIFSFLRFHLCVKGNYAVVVSSHSSVAGTEVHRVQGGHTALKVLESP